MSGAQPLVLIVEDDDDIRELLGLVLSSNGYSVSLAIDGLDAWEQLSSGVCPNLILLDLRMPRLSGAELVARLRYEDRLDHIPVVVVSGDGQAHEAAAALGAEGLLLKPLDLNELLEVVGELSHRAP